MVIHEKDKKQAVKKKGKGKSPNRTRQKRHLSVNSVKRMENKKGLS